MKKIYLFIAFFLPFIATAQPTITQSGLPVPGLVYIMGTDDTYSSAITPGGINQTWDYSSLQNLVNDTSGFMSSVGTPYASGFPAANLAAVDIYTDTWLYFIADATGFYLAGAAGSGTPTGDTIFYTPPQLYAPVPFTYLDTRTNTARIVIDTVVTVLGTPYNARLVRNIRDSFLADGWGTLQLPVGLPYNNVLRAKITEVTRDSAYYDPFSNGNYIPAPSFVFTPTVKQRVIYRWVQDQQPSYLLGINADSLGTIGFYSEYLSSFVVLSNHEVTSSKTSINAYPNPVNHTFHLNNDLNSDVELVITNSLGQEVEKRKISNEKLINVKVENYPSGLYQFSLISKDEKRSGRFTVQH